MAKGTTEIGRIPPCDLLQIYYCIEGNDRPRMRTKGVGPDPTLAWPGWKQPDITVEVDTDRLETSSTEAGVLKKLSLAGIAD